MGFNIFNIVIVYILMSFSTSVLSTCLTPAQKKACDNVFNPNAMKTSCADTMTEYVSRIKTCQDKSGSSVFSCSVSVCVARDQYNITRNGKLDYVKCRELLDRLDKEQPATKQMNQLIRVNCLGPNNDGYKKYVTSDPKCDIMFYVVCAYVNYLIGVAQYYATPSSCTALSNDVKTCKSVLNQYLKQINSKTC
ncbi:uncharacterized protein LOC142987037 [Anticarsia gemmatalis]|uniref:uncharacterized protein LOC142987037 n=1 Tax=Anticarsia gemmatalis TaxID=129554 RepID=UPI003F759301